MKRLLSVILMLACLGVVACHTTQPVTRQALVGTYTYVSKDPDTRATDHNLSHLVLQADGKYDLAEGGTTKAVEEEEGRLENSAWRSP
ncbi:MAG TPA: hypothetical protein VF493_01060 [Terriglobales bacterium]